ncbi:PH domain-containing protein [Salibacterium sp. K-3]
MAKESGKLKKLTEKAKGHLDSDEKVLYKVLGAYETKVMGSESVRNGVLLATNQRLFFFAKKMTGHETESFPYSNISSFESGKGMLGHYMNFFASGNKVSMKWISDGDIDGFIKHIRDTIGKKEAAATTENASSSADELKKIADLRDSGVLTDEEFQEQKQKILNG